MSEGKELKPKEPELNHNFYGVSVSKVILTYAELQEIIDRAIKEDRSMRPSTGEALSKESFKGCDISEACPVHGFEFITFSDGDGHPDSWYDFCQKCADENNENPPELISGVEYLCSRFSRPRIDREKILQAIRLTMPCTCIEAYTKRNLTAPDCAYHNHGEDLATAIQEAYEREELNEPDNQG